MRERNPSWEHSRGDRAGFTPVAVGEMTCGRKYSVSLEWYGTAVAAERLQAGRFYTDELGRSVMSMAMEKLVCGLAAGTISSDSQGD